MGLHKVYFSSKKHDWETPWKLFKHIDAQFGPCLLDVCATKENAKCERFFSLDETNGLLQSWNATCCWMNPPYGKHISMWLEKAICEVILNNTQRVISLLPVRSDTAWWHDYVFPYGEIYFLRGRVKFVGAPYTAPFPSAVVIFKSHRKEQ